MRPIIILSAACANQNSIPFKSRGGRQTAPTSALPASGGTKFLRVKSPPSALMKRNEECRAAESLKARLCATPLWGFSPVSNPRTAEFETHKLCATLLLLSSAPRLSRYRLFLDKQNRLHIVAVKGDGQPPIPVLHPPNRAFGGLVQRGGSGFAQAVICGIPNHHISRAEEVNNILLDDRRFGVQSHAVEGGSPKIRREGPRHGVRHSIGHHRNPGILLPAYPLGLSQDPQDVAPSTFPHDEAMITCSDPRPRDFPGGLGHKPTPGNDARQ